MTTTADTVIVKSQNGDLKKILVNGLEVRVSEFIKPNECKMKLDTKKAVFYYIIYHTEFIRFLVRAMHRGLPIEYKCADEINDNSIIIEESDLIRLLPQIK